MKILIVRHGDPDYEKDSLTEKGFREAELLSEKLKKLDIKAVYCSPLGRAKATMEPTLKKMGLEATICEWLKEFPAYVIDNETGNKRTPWDLVPSFWTKDARFYDRFDWLNTDLMQSGNVKEKYEYVTKSLDELLAKHGYAHVGNFYRVENENDDTIVFFCHFGVECVLLSHILGISPVALWHGFVALPSSVTTLITEEREQGIAYFRCNGFGDISHMYAGDEPPAFAARFCETYSNMEERH
ncbi:MAG: histidine phosphatase family protein [Clostridia bacterium]|nr:histidine phosphatase family protein [Clostridia bacterium]